MMMMSVDTDGVGVTEHVVSGWRRARHVVTGPVWRHGWLLTDARPQCRRRLSPYGTTTASKVSHKHQLWGQTVIGPIPLAIGRVSYIRIYLCYFCFRWKTVSLVQASLQHLMHHVTVSLQQSRITLQNNCINNTSITQPLCPFICD